MQAIELIKDQIQTQSYALTKLAWREIVELSRVLWEDEVILSSVFGRSTEHQWALMVATNKRVIIVNKTLFSCRIDDIPYSAISSIEHIEGLISGRIKVFSRGNTVSFDRVALHLLRDFVTTVEQRIGMPDEQPVTATANLSAYNTPGEDKTSKVFPYRPLIHINRR